MDTNLVHIGFGNMVAMSRVIGMTVLTSAPVKRNVEEARNKGLLITLTNGRKGETALFFDTGHIVLSALETTTLVRRITNEEGAWKNRQKLKYWGTKPRS